MSAVNFVRCCEVEQGELSRLVYRSLYLGPFVYKRVSTVLHTVGWLA